MTTEGKDVLVVPSSSDPQVAVIVLATRNGARLERCLQALANGTGSERVQTVICANAVDADVQDVIRATRGAVVMSSTVNLGTAATWNRAVEAIPAPRFATVHEDACVTPGWLGDLMVALDRDDRAVIAGPQLVWPDGRTQNQGWIQWGDGNVWPIGPDFAPALGELRAVTPVDSVSSATMLVERAFWEAVNGFDEGSFPAVTAEHDLCIAAWASGRRVLTVPAARSVHDTGAMLAPAAGWIGSTAFRNFLIARNLGRLAERWAAFLADRCPAPAEIPDTDAVKGELARIAAADSVVLPSDRWPDRSRLITAEGTGGMDAPPEIERHAQALLDDRRNEFADWAARQIDQLYEQRTNSAEYAASLRDALAAAGEREAAAGERAAAAHERIESISVALSESEAALAARDATMTWRLRSRVTSIPGVASVWRALRGRSADR